MEDPHKFSRYDHLSQLELRDILLKRDDEIYTLRQTIMSQETQISILKSQTQQANLNMQEMENQYKYKEGIFKQERDNFERQLDMLREDFEERVLFA